MSGFSEIIAVLKNNFTPTDAQFSGNSTFRSFFTTTPTSSQLPKVELDAFFWEFSLNNENTEWSRYDDIAQMEIEKAFQAGMTEVVLVHGFFAKNNYIVILRGLGGPMCQKNLSNGNVRSVRRYVVVKVQATEKDLQKKYEGKEVASKQEKQDDKKRGKR